MQLARAKCCTPEIINAWFTDFHKFLEEHSLLNKAEHIWNADEAGFPLCAISGKVVTIHNCRNVYSITADSKEQITSLCAISASGEAILPMHIFPGMRFKYNPMLNCVDGAYFGHSPTGWISTELFYGWLANHFAKRVTLRPVVLLVDSHASHIDIHTSIFCRENQVLLYCLPAHSSHLMQPLDVSFFKALKTAWGKACSNYCSKNPGYQVTKHEFSQIFHEAWIASVRMSTIVNGFREAGLCPFNPEMLLKKKLLPSLQFSSEAFATEQSPITVLESMIGEEKLKKFKERFSEGYDVESDELYCVWSKMKKLCISDDQPSVVQTTKDPLPDATPGNPLPDVLLTTSNPENPASVLSPPKKSSVLDDILVYPSVPDNKKKSKGPSAMPKHLSGEQFVQYLQEKKEQKEKEEAMKLALKEERERKKKEREEQCRLKKLERERKKAEAERKKAEAERKKAERASNTGGRGRGGRGRRGRRGCGRGVTHVDDGAAAITSTETSDTNNSSDEVTRKEAPKLARGDGSRTDCVSSESTEETNSVSTDDCVCCAVCNSDDDGRWIQCDKCDKWFHFRCVAMTLQENSIMENLYWLCPNCN